MINYKEVTPIVVCGRAQSYNRGFHLNSKDKPLIIKWANWEYDISKEDFDQYDYVELNGVRFNKA